jgi:transposase
MKHPKNFLILALITLRIANQSAALCVPSSMQDAVPSTTDSHQPVSEMELLQKEIVQLKDKLAWFETEYNKLAKLMASQNKRIERHISPGDSPWLPFDSQEELEQAKQEAEAEAQKILEEQEASSPAKPKKRRKESLPEHLPEIKKFCDVPEADRVCPEHGPMAMIGVDSTETLVYEPAKLYRSVTEYPKYGCSCCKSGGVVTAERPTGLVEGNKYDTSVAAAVVVQKYDSHLPLYRQTDIFAASGWTPSRSTLLNILRQVAFAVEPFVNHLTRLVQGDSAVGLDESSCRMLMPLEEPTVEPGDLKGKRLLEKIAEAKAAGEDSIIGKMWAYRGLDQAPYNIFDFRISRHRDGPEEFFRNSRCVVQGDCFSGNKSVVLQSNERLQFAACWAHARRKVYEVNKQNPHRGPLLDMIQGLYDVNAREQGLDLSARTAHRQEHAVPILRVIKAYVDTLTDQIVLPKSDMAEALRYIRNHRDALNLYATDGRIPIDNNRVEQLMREVALGRKNWLFVGNVEAGERAASLMTLVSSAKRHQLDVWMYLKDILDRLLAGETDYSTFAPDVWKAAHPEAVRTYREEESRYKADRKKVSRAKRIIAAKQKRERADR